jgi:hypothetical protein
VIQYKAADSKQYHNSHNTIVLPHSTRHFLEWRLCMRFTTSRYKTIE